MIYCIVLETDDDLLPYELKNLLETHRVIKCVNIKDIIPEEEIK